MKIADFLPEGVTLDTATDDQLATAKRARQAKYARISREKRQISLSEPTPEALRRDLAAQFLSALTRRLTFRRSNEPPFPITSIEIDSDEPAVDFALRLADELIEKSLT